MKTSSRSFVYWFIAALFFLYEMVLRASSSVMVNELRESFGLDAQQLGFLSSMYYWAYTPLQIPCGFILDRIGIRRLLALSCLMCAVGAFIFGSTTSPLMAGGARFLMGAGSACGFIGTVTLVMLWFSPQHFGIMISVTNLLGSVGGVFAGKPLAGLIASRGWRQAMIDLSIVGFVFAGAIGAILRDAPRDSLEKPLKLFEALGVVVRNSQIWIAGIIGGLLYVPISVFAEVWVVPFIQSTYHIQASKASLAQTLIYLGAGIGSPISAFLYARLQSYRVTLQGVSLLLAAAFMGVAFMEYVSFPVALGLSALVGLIAGGQILIFSIVKEVIPPYVGGTATAFTNALVMLFPLLLQPLFGSILNYAWSYLDGSVTATGNLVYTAKMYEYAIFSFPLCGVLSFALCFLIRKSFADLSAPRTRG